MHCRPLLPALLLLAIAAAAAAQQAKNWGSVDELLAAFPRQPLANDGPEDGPALASPAPFLLPASHINYAINTAFVKDNVIGAKLTASVPFYGLGPERKATAADGSASTVARATISASRRNWNGGSFNISISGDVAGDDLAYLREKFGNRSFERLPPAPPRESITMAGTIAEVNATWRTENAGPNAGKVFGSVIVRLKDCTLVRETFSKMSCMGWAWMARQSPSKESIAARRLTISRSMRVRPFWNSGPAGLRACPGQCSRHGVMSPR